MCFTLKPDSVLPIKESAISLSATYNDPAYHPTTLKNPINVFFPHDDFTLKPKKFSIALSFFKLDRFVSMRPFAVFENVTAPFLLRNF